MNNPQEIMARIRRNRRQAAFPQRPSAPVPAPAPAAAIPQAPAPSSFASPTPASPSSPVPVVPTPAPASFAPPGSAVVPSPFPTQEAPASQSEPQAAPTREEPRPRLVSRPVGGHALYAELMRSHDRMGTRHLVPTPMAEPPRGEG